MGPRAAVQFVVRDCLLGEVRLVVDPADQVGPGAEAQGADRGRRPHGTSESQTLDDVTAQPRPVALAGRGLEPDASKVGWRSAQLVEQVDEVGGTSLHSMIN